MDQRKEKRKKEGSKGGRERKKEEKNISIDHGNPGPKAMAGVTPSLSVVNVTTINCPIYSPLSYGSVKERLSALGLWSGSQNKAKEVGGAWAWVNAGGNGALSATPHLGDLTSCGQLQ